MGTWGPDSELARRGLDPSEALTVAEAARRTGVSAVLLRRAIEDGRLLHETVRRRGKEVAILRLGDLAELYPAVLGDPAPEPGEEPLDGSTDVPVHVSGDVSGDESGDEPGGESRGAQPRERAAETREARADRHEQERRSDGARHAIELRLASLQAGNAALAGQVDDLKLVREDLREQSDDLRGRLTMLEKERQATTAGLLLAQRRILELESGERPAARKAWRAPERWGMFASLVGLLVFGFAARRAGSELETTLDEARTDRERFGARIAGIETSAREAAAALAQEREASVLLREELVTRLREERVHAEEVAARWRNDLVLAERREERAEQELALARASASSAVKALEEAREALGAEREAARHERERAVAVAERERLASEERLAELLREVESARASTAALVAELERARALEAAARTVQQDDARREEDSERAGDGAARPATRVSPGTVQRAREVLERLARRLLTGRSRGGS